MNRSPILITKSLNKNKVFPTRNFCTSKVVNPLNNEKPIKVGKFELTAPLVFAGTLWRDNLIKKSPVNATKDYRFFEQIANSGINLIDCGEKHTAMNVFNSFRNEYASTNPNAKIYTSMTYLPLLWDVSEKNTPSFVLQENLKRLDAKCFDIFNVHNTTGTPLEAWAHALADAHDAGEVKEIGVSGFDAKDIVRFHKILIRRGLKLASCRVEFNLVRTQPIKSGIFDICRDLDIVIFAANPLATGMLTGKYTEEEPPQFLKRLGKTFAVTGSVLDLLNEIGSHHNKTPAQVALNWVLCHGAVPIMTMKHETMERDLNAFGWRLSESEIKALDKASIHGPSILDVFGI